MKLLKLFAAFTPLFAATVWAADVANHGIVTPESLFPQLDAILKHAVSQSPSMISQAVNEEIAENERVIARSNLLPTVGGYYNLNGARDKRGDLAGSLDVTKIYYNFSVIQPLFFWGERKNLDRIGAIRLEMTKGNVREGYRLLAQEVRTAYLRLIADKLRARRAALSDKRSAAILKRSEDQLTKKVISEAQIFTIRIEAERALVVNERTQFDYENNKLAFSRLTGMPVLRDEEIPDVIPPITPQTEAVQGLLSGYLSQADNPNPEAVTLRQTLDIEKLNLANSKTRLRPKVSVMAGTSQDEQSYTTNTAQKYSVQSYYAGVKVDWQVFDGFAARSAVRSNRAHIRQLESDYRQLNERLATQAQNQAKMLGFYSRYVSINDRLLESSEGHLRSRKEEFSRGVISEEDVGLAEIGLVDSTILAYGSRTEYYTGVCDFLGTVMEDPVLTNLPPSR